MTNFYHKWKNLRGIYKTLIVITLVLTVTYFISSFRTENIKIELSREYTDFQGTHKSPFYVNQIDAMSGSSGCTPQFSESGQTIKVVNLPKNFEDFKIQIHCIDAIQKKDDSLKKAYWSLKHVVFSVEYPIGITTYPYSTQKNVLKEKEYFLIENQRFLQTNGINLESGQNVGFTMQFMGLEPMTVGGEPDKYSTSLTYPQPTYLIFQLRWFELPNIIDFLKQRVGDFSRTILDYVIR